MCLNEPEDRAKSRKNTGGMVVEEKHSPIGKAALGERAAITSKGSWVLWDARGCGAEQAQWGVGWGPHPES